MEASNKEKNIEIAKMLGFYISENNSTYYLTDISDNIRKLLPENWQKLEEVNVKFDSDFNFQLEALYFICQIGKTPLNVNGNIYDYKISNNCCEIYNKFDKNIFSVKVQSKTQNAIFECLYTFAKFYNL